MISNGAGFLNGVEGKIYTSDGINGTITLQEQIGVDGYAVLTQSGEDFRVGITDFSINANDEGLFFAYTFIGDEE